jgi:hypothetical protein
MDDLRYLIYPLWLAAAVLALAGIVWALLRERRGYALRGLAGSWLWVRAWTLPALLLAAAGAVVPAMLMSGPEALGAFYLLLFTLSPALFFGMHWLAGRTSKPALARGESFALAARALALGIGLAMAAPVVQGVSFTLAHSLHAWRAKSAPAAPLPATHIAQSRLHVPTLGTLETAHWRLDADAQIERFMQRYGEAEATLDTRNSHWICRAGRELHLVWQAHSPPPPVALIWKNAGGDLQRSEWAISPSQRDASEREFSLRWQADAVHLPTPLPAALLLQAHGEPNTPDAQLRTQELPLSMDAAASCVSTIPRTPTLAALVVRLWDKSTQQMQFAYFRAP